MAQYASYADYFERGPQRPFVVQNRLSGSAQVSLTRLSNNPAGAHRSPSLSELLLIVAGGGAFHMRYNLGLGWREGRFRRGDLLLAPPEVANEYLTDSPTSFGTIALPMAFVEACLAESGGRRMPDFGVLHDRFFRDAAIEAHAFSLLASTAATPDPLYVDERLVGLVDCLVDKADRIQARRERHVSLDEAQIERVREFIESQLDGDLNLAVLSQVSGLSLAHFARAFRRSVGIPPHRYVMQRRVARAKQLLRATDRAIAEIALDCGFSSQAHMTAIFSRLVGATPARFRNAS
jgi:AraC-like DNA-binding protein